MKGIRNPKEIADYLRHRCNPIHLLNNVSLALISRFPIGTHVFEREWDILVVLDTCRVDAMRMVAPEYDFIDGVDRIWSLGGSSPDWIAHTFDRAYESILADTAYISSNPHSEKVLESYSLDRGTLSPAARRFFRYGRWEPVNPTDIGRYERVWKYEAQNEGQSEYHRFEDTTPPRYVTDRAIDISRKHNFDRIILDYMPPHYPYIANALKENRGVEKYEERPRASKRYGRPQVFAAYLDNLRFVLDDVDILLSNVDAEHVVLTADHGDAFGEYGMYGHNPGRIHPDVRYVPWVETTATDSGAYRPELELVEEGSRSSVNQLEALGYIH